MADVAVGAGVSGLTQTPASQTLSPLQSLSCPQPLEVSEHPESRIAIESTVTNCLTATSLANGSEC